MRAQDSLQLRIVHYYLVDHSVGYLSWNSVSTADTYQVFRHYPDEDRYTLCAATPDTHFTDTLHRVICGDTVGYYVGVITPDTTIHSDTVGIYYQDNLPTTPCRLRVATIDTTSGRILLTWYPSPDTDVMGYYICMGSPCRDFDTVWGRLNTQYLCPDTLSDSIEYSFRVLAFDSCFQASPLTPYYHNPVLHIEAPSCSRDMHFSWNRYINMPDSVVSYCVCYSIAGSDTVHRYCTPPEGPYDFDTTISALEIGAVTAWLEVLGRSASLKSVTRPRTFHFEYGDTADYLSVREAVYDETIPAITVTLAVDSTYRGDEYYLLRSSDADTLFRRVATLPGSDFVGGRGLYVDRDIKRTVERYTYLLEAPDICHQRTTRSDTLSVTLPPVGEITAFFPNCIIYNHPEVGSFCPVYLSPLADGYSLEIFSRWGNQVFHTDRLGDCWDGTSEGEPLPQGAYVYLARCKHADGSVKLYKGTVLLLK